jgi:hypothetical protein
MGLCYGSQDPASAGARLVMLLVLVITCEAATLERESTCLIGFALLWSHDHAVSSSAHSVLAWDLTYTLHSMPWLMAARNVCPPGQPQRRLQAVTHSTSQTCAVSCWPDSTTKLHHSAFTSHIISTHAHTNCQMHSHRRSMCLHSRQGTRQLHCEGDKTRPHGTASHVPCKHAGSRQTGCNSIALHIWRRHPKCCGFLRMSRAGYLHSDRSPCVKSVWQHVRGKAKKLHPRAPPIEHDARSCWWLA